MAAGGLARVFKVRSPEGKICAAKVLGEEFLKDRKKKERFCSEFHILSRLHSPRIIKAIDLIKEKKVCALILEYVEGIELSQLLKQAPFPEEVTLHLVLEISLAFQECHKHQLFHRDLKPENILISKRGQVKLIDFGVAKDPDLKRTQQGTVLGTLEYMAPEQISGTSEKVDQRADLYALGVLTYEMLSRRLPIKINPSDNILNVLKKKKDHKLPKGKISSGILENFCMILTHPDPEERPQTIDEVIEFIRKYKKTPGLKSSFKEWINDYWTQLSQKPKSKTISKESPTIANDPPPPSIPPGSRLRFLRYAFITAFSLSSLMLILSKEDFLLASTIKPALNFGREILEFLRILAVFFS